MKDPAGPDFYEVERAEWRKSLLVFAGLILFYVLAIGLITFAAVFTFGVAVAGGKVFTGPFLLRTGAAVLAASILIALFHYLEARRFGAAAILKRLEAAPPDPADRYHQRFADTVEEMRLACGLPRVEAYVIPSFSVNSMAVVQSNGTPAVAVTEGLLADDTRDELQAVVAHELAHISRGDAVYVTLVCSLANFLEGLRSALEPDDSAPDDEPAGARRGRRGGPPVLIALAVGFSSLVMHLLSMLLSREREVLADAAAAEICRNPAALARVLYKAHLKSTLVADFSQSYSPLFILAPDLSSDDGEGVFSRLFNSHPPVMRRIKLLAAMAGLSPADIMNQVAEELKLRRESRGVLLSRQETAPAASGSPRPGPEARRAEEVGDRRNRCPRCGSVLDDTLYEGVPIQVCPGCGGRLVSAAYVDRILLRREIDFSPALIAKAARFREESEGPARARLLAMGRAAAGDGPACPSCGYGLAARPFSYQFFLPVDKCLACGRIWFDADELEILQILVEKKA